MRALSQNPDPDSGFHPLRRGAERLRFGRGRGHPPAGGAGSTPRPGAHRSSRKVVGYGATCDAYHMTAPRPDGSGGAKAMAMAIADAGRQAGGCGLYQRPRHLHPPERRRRDRRRQVRVRRTRLQAGHELHQVHDRPHAGAPPARWRPCSAPRRCRRAISPATIHYQVPDPACDLDVVPNQGRSADIAYALSNSLGFGGHNGTLLFKKWEA